MARRRVRKALCYIVRDGELLVFRHRGVPAAGLQVPAGTIGDAEDPGEAALREAREETGYDGSTLVRHLGVYERPYDEAGRHELQERHVFELRPPGDLPERFAHFAEGTYWFEFSWTEITPELTLAGDQHHLLGRLTSRAAYPLVRLRKLTPHGAVRTSWYCYRLPDEAGFVRLFVPAGTRRLHASGSWSPDGVSVAALHPERSYVVHWWQGEGRSGFYVDAARSIEVRASAVSYVDLYLDLACDRGSWSLLDEDELSQASEEDTRLARGAIAEVRRLIAAGDPLFDPSGDLWTIPADALRLKPQQVKRLI